MKKSIFVVVYMGGSYEDHWTRNYKWCFTTFKEAEDYLFRRHYKKCTGWLYRDNYYEPMMLEDDYEARESQATLAKIETLNYWE